MENDIKIITENNKIKIYTPFSYKFVEKIKDTGAQWNGSAWIIEKEAIDIVREILLEVYGRTDKTYTDKYVSVEIKFLEECCVWHGGVEFFGKPIAWARGRDSGVKYGENVFFKAGKARSGGSVKNWETIILKDSVCVVTKVPETLAKKECEELNKEGVLECKILEDEIQNDKTNLLEEQDRLEKRLEEINKLLAEI